MQIDDIIQEVKTWLEEDCGPGFGYRFNHCLDLSSDLEVLKERLVKKEEGLDIIETSGYAADVDGDIVVDCDHDWPNEWRDQDFKKVKVIIEPRKDESGSEEQI